MKETWKKQFSPVIWQRGQKYYKDGTVTKVHQDGNTITATVSGSDSYQVAIRFLNGEPEDMDCTCPFSEGGANCKHMAAVLCAIDAGEFTFTEEPKIDPIAYWHSIMTQLPFETVYSELLRTVLRNEDLQERLIIHLNRGLPDGMLKDWRKLLTGYSRDLAFGSRYIDNATIPRFIHALTEFLDERLDLLKEVHAVWDAFQLIGLVFETATKRIQNPQDEHLLGLLRHCQKEWLLMFDYATSMEKKQMHSWYWSQFNRFSKFSSMGLDMRFLFLPWSKTLLKRNLFILDQRLASCDDEQSRSFLMDCRIEVMNHIGCSYEDEQAFWKKHLQHDAARHRLLEDYYNAGQLDKVIKLLCFLKTMDTNDSLRQLQDSAWLLLMYRHVGETEPYTRELEYLLTTARSTLEQLVPNTINRTTARTFVAHLNAVRSCKDDAVIPLLDELIDAVCSNPAVARKGVIEIIASAGYEWPKPYRFES